MVVELAHLKIIRTGRQDKGNKGYSTKKAILMLNNCRLLTSGSARFDIILPKYEGRITLSLTHSTQNVSQKEIEKMNLIKRAPIKSLILLMFLLGFTAQSQAMKSPDVVVKETVDTMVSKLQANRALYTKDNTALYAMLNEVLIPALHVDRMADLILGREFSRSSSAAQKKAFVAEFKTFLLQSYATGLLNASGDEKVVYEPVILAPGVDKVKVKARLVSAAGEEYPITLSMSNRNDTQWRAYNLDVAGINFIRTYRSSFAQTLQEKGIDGLVADLRAKNAR